GTVLPETGGIGTKIFYIAGGALAVVAVVLLITKKRMTSK
ncbi:MAG: LPXTG cell wall anchor domain-containing protein, partial [Clostridia bacterium]|nr:LPXTG cell wall anchor domain-containing protein [Clostridia bacterium]